MKEFSRYIKKVILRIGLLPFKLLAVKKNRIIMINDIAYNYSDSIKCISELLNQKYTGKFDIVISVKRGVDIDFLKKKKYKIVYFNSLNYFFKAMTSKIIISNSGGYSYLPLRKNQYVINTWHGGGAGKKMGVDVYGNTALFRKDLLMNNQNTNIQISSCRVFSNAMIKSMLIDSDKIWEIGIPRNDILVNGDEKIRQIVRKKLGINQDERLVLFAPTYRKVEDDYFNDSIAISYGIDAKGVLEALEDRFGYKWKFAIRLHPCVVNRDEHIIEDTIDLTNYPDMQELLLAADVMINDFSSSMWDFMLTGKPCFLFALDMNSYIDNTGLYIPYEELPYSKARNNEELKKNIRTYNEEKYRMLCDLYYKKVGGCETGKATELVVNKIVSIINN